MKTTEYTLPSYWGSYLINGDASGLSDSEEQEISEFLRVEGYPQFTSWSEGYFATSNDASPLGGDVSDAEAYFAPSPSHRVMFEPRKNS
jgi:hypothetical protein